MQTQGGESPQVNNLEHGGTQELSQLGLEIEKSHLREKRSFLSVPSIFQKNSWITNVQMPENHSATVTTAAQRHATEWSQISEL